MPSFMQYSIVNVLSILYSTRSTYEAIDTQQTAQNKKTVLHLMYMKSLACENKTAETYPRMRGK